MKARITLQEISKEFIEAAQKTSNYVRASGLDHQLLELIDFRVSTINGCAYCLDMHFKDAVAKGESEQRLYSLAAWRECPYYSEKERAALAYAEAVTASEVNDAVFDALTPFFNKKEIADLTLAIASINTWNRLNQAFRTVPGGYKVGQYAQKTP
jgi:AhpD family alkylhydroperoxidase